jgi:hypothetical protein
MSVLTRFSRSPLREIDFVINAYFQADRPRAIRQGEDLLIVLADKRFRSALPHLFPGVAGRAPIDFTASWDIPRGELPAIRRMALPLVLNELDLFPGRNLYELIPRLFETAEALCERGVEITAADGHTIRLGGFFPTEVERKVCLGAILAAGETRITLAPFTEDTFSFQTAPREEPQAAPPPPRAADFLRALVGGQTVADALVAAGFVSAALRDVFKGAATLKRRFSAAKPTQSRRSQKTRVRVRPVR